jgi:dihydroflavonol-4-reductase
MQMIDVCDVADVHLALMTPGSGPRRYMCGGMMVPFDGMISALERGAGRELRRVRVSPKAFRGVSRIGDVLGRLVPMGNGLSYEAALLLTAATPTDDTATVRDLGIMWRSPTDAIIASFPRSHGGDENLSDPGV